MSNLLRGRSKGALELRNVVKNYSGERVVDSICTSIAPGEFFSLLGPSGSGKTTTLTMIAGFANVDGGSISLDGNNIVEVPPQRRGFGMVFQNYAIFPHLNVFDNVAFPLRARKVAADVIRKLVTAALELVRLERFADRYARQLSGGQQQRVAIARAIVFQPSVVLMDEPMGALDKNLRYEMQEELKEIQRKLGMTVVYVTHDQEEAMNMSDRIAIMNKGKIEQVGAPSDVYERPTTAFVARFLGEANLITGSIVESADGFAVLRTPGGLRFRARTHQPLPDGRTAHLFIRPEKIRVTTGRAGELDCSRVHTTSGTVCRSAFLGSINRHSIDIERGVRLTVDVQNGQTGESIAVGTDIIASWLVSDSVILPD